MSKRKFLKFIIPVVVLFVVYVLGPHPAETVYSSLMPAVPSDAAGLEAYVAQTESRHQLKPDNQARIVWADSSKQKTTYSVVYLHGFSATWKEGDPVHLRFAKKFGANLYLARLADHGVDTTETLLQYTAARSWASACEALAIGEKLGHKVILLSTSTGGTLALMLAKAFPEKVHALINLSPNIAINDDAAFLLNNPWGLQIARLVLGGDYRTTSATGEKAQYWNNKYRIESLVQLQALLEDNMTEETFAAISAPSLTLYYFKDEEHQDPEVRVSGMLEMHRQLGTPDSLKEAIAVPTAGAHVLGGALASKDVETVYQLMEKFALDKLKMLPAGNGFVQSH